MWAQGENTQSSFSTFKNPFSWQDSTTVQFPMWISRAHYKSFLDRNPQSQELSQWENNCQICLSKNPEEMNWQRKLGWGDSLFVSKLVHKSTKNMA